MLGKKAHIPADLKSDDRKIVYSVLDMQTLANLLIPFQIAKDKEYQSHWAHRGILGYKDGCILRQIDRIEPGFDNLIEACLFDDNGQIIQENTSTLAAASLLDTLVDTVVYGLLGVCLISSKFPDAGKAYKRKLLHRVINGFDMADKDLDFDGLSDEGLNRLVKKVIEDLALFSSEEKVTSGCAMCGKKSTSYDSKHRWFLCNNHTSEDVLQAIADHVANPNELGPEELYTVVRDELGDDKPYEGHDW